MMSAFIACLASFAAGAPVPPVEPCALVHKSGEGRGFPFTTQTASATYREGDRSTVDFQMRSRQQGRDTSLDLTVVVTVTAVGTDGTATLELDFKSFRLSIGEVEAPDPGMGKISLKFDKHGLPVEAAGQTEGNLPLVVFAGTMLPATELEPGAEFEAAWARSDGFSCKAKGRFLGLGELDGQALPKLETTAVFSSPSDPDATFTGTSFFDPKRGYVVRADGTLKAEDLEGTFTFRRR